MNTGVLSYQELRELGMSRTAIEHALARGVLMRVARGWYATTEAHPGVVSALKAGARVGCLTGCDLYGLWTPRHGQVHAVYPENRGVRPAKGLVLHSSTHERFPRGIVWPLWDCLDQVARRHDAESALIVLESAVNLGQVTDADARSLISALPLKAARAMSLFDVAESGSETRVRLFFQRRRVPVIPQAYIAGIGRVDLLVGDRLIIECDSREFHGPDRQVIDRSRDLAAMDLGLERIRLSYPQIWHTWASTQVSLNRALQRRLHR